MKKVQFFEHKGNDGHKYRGLDIKAGVAILFRELDANYFLVALYQHTAKGLKFKHKLGNFSPKLLAKFLCEASKRHRQGV